MKKIPTIYRNAAIRKVTAAVRVFMEANCAGIRGEINIPVVEVSREMLDQIIDNDMLERMSLNSECLKALQVKNIQRAAEKDVLDNHRSLLKKVTLEVTESHVHAHLTFKKRM